MRTEIWVKKATLLAIAVLFITISGTALAAEKINFACFRPSYQATLDKLIATFTKETGIEVETTFITDMNTKIPVLAAAGTMPDVLLLPNNYTASFGELGVLMDHTELAKSLKRSDYIPGVWEENFWRGKMYTIPLATTARNLLYRSDNFSEAGLDALKPPATFAEVGNYAGKLSRVANGEVTKLGWTQIEVQSLLSLFKVSGANLFNTDGTQATFNTEPAVKTLEWWQDVWKKIAPAGAKIPAGSDFNRFMNGTLGLFWWSTDPIIREIRAKGGSDDEVENFRVGPPFPGEKRPSTPLFTIKLAITTQAKNPTTAWKFIEFFERPDVMASFAIDEYRVPPRLSALRSSAYMHGASPLLRHEGEMASMYGTEPIYSVAPDLNGLLDKQVKRFTAGEVPAAQALNEAVRLVNLSIDKALKK